MKIGLSGGGTIERMLDQAAEAEADGFSSLWYAGAIGYDPLMVIALVGQRTSTIELGTSIVQTYPRHPVSMAQSTVTARAAVGSARLTLGVGVSHQPAIEGYGLSFDKPARHLSEYLRVLTPVLKGEQVDVQGDQYRVRMDPRPQAPTAPDVPVLVAALGPAMLKVTGRRADGTITWMANRVAIDKHVAPLLRSAAEDAGRASPRIVVGLPVAVCDEAQGREEAAKQFAGYGMLPNYQRILQAGGAGGPGDAAIVGSEERVAGELEALIENGATDIWAAVFPVGDDRAESRRRTRALLKELATPA